MMMLPELRNYVGIEEYRKDSNEVDSNQNLPIVEAKLIEDGLSGNRFVKDSRTSFKNFPGNSSGFGYFWWNCFDCIGDWYI